MEADWDELHRISFPPPAPNGVPTPPTTTAFDTSQELVWAGNEYGRVTSFYGTELSRYTSYRAHPPSEGPVKQLLFCDKGVLSISSRSVHLAIRRGLTQWHLTHEKFRDLRCMSYTSKGTHEILVAGNQDTMFRVDVEKGTINDTLPAEDSYTILKRSGHYICAATMTGFIHVLDLNTFRVLKKWQAHSAWINDMDAKSDTLITCGWSARQQAGFHPDPLANAYDLKTLAPLPPIPFQPGAAWVRMHPRMSSTAIIVSSTGSLQVIDVILHNTLNIRQANIFDGWSITGLELAPSGEALTLTDSHCNIQLWGSPTKIHYTEYPNPTEFPDQVAPTPAMDWSPETPLSTVGMPYYRELLLSAWPNHMLFEVGAPAPKIDSVILATLKRAEIGGYAANPRKTRRNQIQNTRTKSRASDALTAPKFLSEKAREGSGSDEPARRMSDALESLADMSVGNATRKDVPIMYRNVEIKYSRFGVDDFDFEYYNKTPYSGLETHISNSYANPLLQLYKFTTLIRNLALHHTATSCLFENCLLCEMGFLIDMLEKAGGQNCQATNLLKTFSGLTSAASLNLLEELSPNSSLTAMIQALNLFLLDKLAADYRQMSPPQASHLEQALTTAAVATIRCGHCLNEMRQHRTSFVHELVYPPKTNPKNLRTPRASFSQVLKTSIEQQMPIRGWCDRCKRYQQLTTRRAIQKVPAIFTFNAAIHTAEAKQLWSTPNWLPQEIGIIVDQQGQFFCYEGHELQAHLQRGVQGIQVYELIGVVADISSGEHQKPHLVSMVNVAPSSKDASANNQWHLFNDFLVRQTSREEALRFEPTWKLPSVITYQIKSASHIIDDSWKDNLDTSLLYRRFAAQQDDDFTKFRLLDPQTESPIPGHPVAIDAEFVSLQREEIEIKADGSRETIRPSRLGLARVSVLRGAGDDTGLPFLDDYISITEPVVDYLTAYSGISPGDLDRSTSRHVLVSLKVAYKKLWLLLNLGVVFVGHGLAKDFRTINIHVPRAQVVDTVDLYFIRSRQRKLNLRFLAWLVLSESIQTDSEIGHDSVEDARTALRLWRKFQEWEDDGVVQEKLEWVYKRGREVGFKAPIPLGRGQVGRSDTPEPGRSEAGGSSGGPETPMGTPARNGGMGGYFTPGGSLGFGSPAR